MWLSQCVIDLKSLERGSLCFGKGIGCRQGTRCISSTQEIVGVGKSAVSERELRIGLNRLLIIVERLEHSVLGSLVPIKSAFQIKLIGLVAVGVILGQPFLLTRNLEP